MVGESKGLGQAMAVDDWEMLAGVVWVADDQAGITSRLPQLAQIDARAPGEPRRRLPAPSRHRPSSPSRRSRVDQTLALPVAEQQRAERLARTLALGPADDHKLLPVEAFGL